MKQIRNNNGFTLVELSVGLAIFAIIMTVIFGVLYQALKTQQYNLDAGANIQDARAIISEASNEIRYATAISSPASNTHASTITYQLAGDSATRMIALGAGYVLFTDAAGNVHRLGSGRVTSLDFVYVNSDGASTPCPKNVTIRLQVQANASAPLSDLTTSVVTYNGF